ncbi:MAG: cation transporter [Salinibacter sp.]|uniref:cation transporter n=1 Tax=Salinibacter sp. TaxID=2065818 RepID=UPI0035D3F406
MRSFNPRTVALLVLFTVGGGLVLPAQAQLQKIEQTIFGMDCAPCAHAMEQSIGSMDGVEAVSVSLNNGLATIDLSTTNALEYENIRKAIANGGFSARKATLKVRGTLRRQGDRWVLETPTGEQFVLQSSAKEGREKAAFQDLHPNRQVIVSGQVPASPETEGPRWPLRLHQVRSAT